MINFVSSIVAAKHAGYFYNWSTHKICKRLYNPVWDNWNRKLKTIILFCWNKSSKPKVYLIIIENYIFSLFSYKFENDAWVWDHEETKILASRIWGLYKWAIPHI